MEYEETDSTRPANKIHKVVRAKSKSKKKKKKRKTRKTQSMPRVVGFIPEPDYDADGGSIFDGGGDGGGMGESYDPSILEGIGQWALSRLFKHAGAAAIGSTGESSSGSNSNINFTHELDKRFKDVSTQYQQDTFGEQFVRNSLMSNLVENGLNFTNSFSAELLYEEDDSKELKIGSYQTKHFYICPGAISAFPKIEKKIGGEKAAELAKLADNIFRIEADVLDAGEANEKSTKKAKSIYKMLMDKADKYNVTDKLDYMSGHLEIIQNPEKRDK